MGTPRAALDHARSRRPATGDRGLVRKAWFDLANWEALPWVSWRI